MLRFTVQQNKAWNDTLLKYICIVNTVNIVQTVLSSFVVVVHGELVELSELYYIFIYSGEINTRGLMKELQGDSRTYKTTVNKSELWRSNMSEPLPSS